MFADLTLLADASVTLDHPVVVFASVMLILLVAPLVFERLRIPGIVGLIVAGVILGPHGAKLFRDDATFQLLGTVGLLYLMFLAGLEINASDFRANRTGSLVFGGLTFAIPMVAGTLLARWFVPDFSWVQSILLASMFASHTLIPHPIAARLGLSRHRAVITAVGGTIFTDTAALLVLAVIAEITRTALSPWFLARQLVYLALVVVVVLRGIPRIGYWFFRRVEPDDATEFIFVIALVFLSSVGALLAGVEAIIGAFLAGIAFSSLVPERGVLRNRLEFTGHALFIPFFLLRVGMLVNPGIIFASWEFFRISVLMCSAVFATKWIAAMGASKSLGFDQDEGWLIFGLSVNQAAATLAAVLVGCDIGLFNEAILNGTVTMILVTCLIGPWFTERYGRRIASSQKTREPQWKSAAGCILAAIGSRWSADRILDLAMLLSPGGEKRIHALHVVPEGPGEEQGILEADRVLAAAIVRGSAAGLKVEGVTRIAATSAQGIVRAARELRASILVLGWAERSAARLFLFRSLLDRVLSSAHGQTLVVGRWPHAIGTARRIWTVVPPLVERQDGLPEGLRALCTIARRAGAGLSVRGAAQGVPRLRAALQQVAEKLQPEVAAYSSWEEVLPMLQRELRSGDLLALLGARRSQAGWDSAMERFPSVLAHTFPEHNLLVIFPPLAHETTSRSSAEEPADQAPGIRARLLDRCADTALFGWVGALDEVVECLLERAMGKGPAMDAIRAALMRNGPVELDPGVVLLHTHASGLETALVLLATGNIRSADAEALRIVLCLVSPFSDPPEQHLAILSEIVRKVQKPGLVEQIAAATAPADIRAAFNA